MIKLSSISISVAGFHHIVSLLLLSNTDRQEWRARSSWVCYPDDTPGMTLTFHRSPDIQEQRNFCLLEE